MTVVALHLTEPPYVFGSVLKAKVSGKTTEGQFAVGAVVARAVEEHPDAQGDELFQLDFFLFFFNFLIHEIVFSPLSSRGQWCINGRNTKGR